MFKLLYLVEIYILTSTF